jgi:hypothetical protein
MTMSSVLLHGHGIVIVVLVAISLGDFPRKVHFIVLSGASWL